MNISHYFLGFPPFHGGGLMIYARDLAKEQLKMGHNVSMLMPGKHLKYTRESVIKYYKINEGLQIYQIINAQPVSFSGIVNPEEFIKEKIENNYHQFLKKNYIQVLHVHSLIGFPIELLEEAKKLKIKTVFTTHDYFGLCPKIFLYKYNNVVCDDFNSGKDCVLCNCNTSDNSQQIKLRNLMLSMYYDLIKLLYNVKPIKKIYHLLKEKKVVINEQEKYDSLKVDEDKAIGFLRFRNYYKNIIEQFDTIIFNSNVTKKEYDKYVNLNNTKQHILPVTHSMIKDNRNIFDYQPTINNKVIFLFMGYLTEKKGFCDLVSVLNEIKENYSNWKMAIYGEYSHVDLDKFDKKFFEFCGRYKHDDLFDIFSNSSILIMPSKLKETFGFVGLEAYSYGIPILASENVGFEQYVKNGENGIVYKESRDRKYIKDSLISILENPQLLYRFNKELLENDFKFLIRDHCNEIVDCYASLL